MDGKSRKIRIGLLKPSDINLQVVEDIATLLRKQHGGVLPISETFLLDYIQHTNKKVAVVLRGDKVIGVATLVTEECLSHWFGTIKNFVIDNDRMRHTTYLTYAKKMLKVLINRREPCPETIRIGGWVQDSGLYGIFEMLGFEIDDLPWFKIRLKKAIRRKKKPKKTED